MIVALTAGVLLEEKQQALAAGMNDFIAKPIRAAELREAVQKYLAPKAA